MARLWDLQQLPRNGLHRAASPCQDHAHRLKGWQLRLLLREGTSWELHPTVAEESLKKLWFPRNSLATLQVLSPPRMGNKEPNTPLIPSSAALELAACLVYLAT